MVTIITIFPNIFGGFDTSISETTIRPNPEGSCPVALVDIWGELPGMAPTVAR
jgi:hypothetical protein